jgi:Ricin-type beta-trefoil lectin domain
MLSKAKLFALVLAAGAALLAAPRAEAMLLTQSVSFDVTLCVDVKGSSPTSGTVVWAHPCNGTVAEQWSFIGPELQVLEPGRCLTTENSAQVAGTPVVLATCNGRAGQSWGYDEYWIYLLGTDLCLDSEPGSDHQLLVNKCSATAATQQWTLH